MPYGPSAMSVVLRLRHDSVPRKVLGVPRREMTHEVVLRRVMGMLRGDRTHVSSTGKSSGSA